MLITKHHVVFGKTKSEVEQQMHQVLSEFAYAGWKISGKLSENFVATKK